MVLAWHVQHTPGWCSRRWRPLRWSVGLSFCLARAPHLGRDEAPVLPMGRTRAAGGGRRDAAQVGGRGERSFCRPIYPALSLPLVYLCLSVRPSVRPSVRQRRHPLDWRRFYRHRKRVVRTHVLSETLPRRAKAVCTTRALSPRSPACARASNREAYRRARR